MQGVGMAGSPAAEAQAVQTPLTHSSAGSPGGGVAFEKDAQEAATAPQFGDIYKQIQAKYGAKAEKPREIKKTLGKDDFLRIMLTQMKNQDPTNPFKPEQMATEIAQFTNVEQLQNINQNLGRLETQNRSAQQLGMTHLIGKLVTIDRERFPHNEGDSETLHFVLPKNAAQTEIEIVNDAGETVLEKSLGPEKAGEVSFIWDGVKSNTLPAKAGNYTLRIDAKDERGASLDINPQVQARVIGVSFEGAEPVFLVGTAQHHDKVQLRSIVKIDEQEASPPKEQSRFIPAPHLNIPQSLPQNLSDLTEAKS